MKKKKILFLIAVLTVSIFCYGVGYSLGEEKETAFENLDIFAEGLSTIENTYVEEKPLKDLIYGAMKGTLASLDSYSQFLTPDDYKNLIVETEGKFGGLGIEITIRDGVLTIISPIEDTPAWEAGIQPEDVIIEIDGESTKEITLNEAVKKLRGDPGTKVTLTVLHPGQQDVSKIEITRKIIKIEDIKNSSILENDIGYVKISEFRESTAKDLETSLVKLKAKGLAGLILDIRNNPGGLLSSAVDVSSLFLKKGSTVVSTDSRNQKEKTYESNSFSTKILDIPIVVLINKGSASGSEIVAAALSDNGRAVLMGETTFGKGSVQTIIPLSDGSAMRLTTSRYYTPEGISIHEKGVEPDITVEKKEVNEKKDVFQRLKEEKNFEYEKDYQIIRALDLMKGLIILNNEKGVRS
ncbi:MAG: S41 family peptidase [Candidatus Omnitrophica bacterium]|nr:S41 family peptidase [Candidatus Omnitrophota bacterium]MCF7892372.1 S41 family peptidase [Candidatus Omnitrophota bacterium]